MAFLMQRIMACLAYEHEVFVIVRAAIRQGDHMVSDQRSVSAALLATAAALLNQSPLLVVGRTIERRLFPVVFVLALRT